MIDIRLSREPMENHKELMQQKPPKGHPHKDHTQKKIPANNRQLFIFKKAKWEDLKEMGQYKLRINKTEDIDNITEK